MTTSHEKHHYTECGLDNLWLVGNGVEFIGRPSGREARTRGIEGPHCVIG